MTTSDSIFLSALAALWQSIKTAWAESCIGRFLHRAWLGFRRLVAGSAICQFLWREGVWTRRWEDSLFCRTVDWVLNLIPRAFDWVHRKAARVIDNSIAMRLLGSLQSRMYLLVGLLFLIMLVAPHSMWNNLYGFAGVLALAALFYLGGLAQHEMKVQTKALSVFFAVYAIFVAYSFLLSDGRRLSLRFLCFHLTCLILVILLVSCIKNTKQLETLIFLLLLGLVIASLYGCYQRVIGIEVVASQQDLVLNEGMPARVYSFFDNPNNFAEILVMVMPFFLALLLNWKGAGAKLMVLLGAAICLVAIGMTYGRASWIGLALAFIVFVGMQNWRFIPLFVVLGLAAMPLLPQTIVNRIFTIGNMEDSSTSYRFAIYEAVGNLLKDRWHTGVGLGSDVVRSAFETYPTMFDGSYPIHAHNNYLQIWCEMGVGGILSFLALLLYQLKSGLRAFYNGYGSRRMKNLLAAAVAGFCGILVVSIAEYTWFYPRNMFLFWLLLGIISTCVKLGKEQEKAQTA